MIMRKKAKKRKKKLDLGSEMVLPVRNMGVIENLDINQ